MRIPILAMALAAVMATAAPAAECAPERMARVVYRNASPGVDPASFAGQPKTMHRLGSRYARVEEGLNPATGREMLVVVNEPDVWFFDRRSRKGQHTLDPGPVFEFRAPIFSGRDVPPVFAKLETGCEFDFMATYAPRPVGKTEVDGVTLDRHEVSVGADRIEILVWPGRREVFSVARHRGGEVRMVRYDQYAVDLAPDMTLFQRPEGVAFTEPVAAAPKP